MYIPSLFVECTVTDIATSSAKKQFRTRLSVGLGMSKRYMLKRTSTRPDPCGTPNSIGFIVETISRYDTEKGQLARLECINLIRWGRQRRVNVIYG